MTPAEPMLAARLATLPSVTLNELVQAAELQTRTDRKYLVSTAVLVAMLDELAGSTATLQIGHRRLHDYSSVYFDTADLLCFREHRQGRRRRFKVRTRTYLDTRDCLLEVKMAGRRGQTVKRRMDYRLQDASRLTAPGRGFAAEALDGHPAVGALRPVLVTDYRRATLLDRQAGSRITIDVALTFSGPSGVLPAPDTTVVIETKSVGGAGRADRVLRRLGVREASLSKYCIGIAMQYPGLPANRWHRVLGRHFTER
jgi:hypothetical protein